jgi:hypothetical protein
MSASSALVATENRLASGPTSLPIGGGGRSRLAAVGPLVEASGDVKGLNLLASYMMSTWVDTPCDSRVTVGFVNGSSDDGDLDENLIGITVGENGALKGLNLGTSDVLGTWVGTPCDPRVPDDFETAWFLPWGSSKDGALDGNLVGITPGAAIGVEETASPSGITIGAEVDVVDTEGFTNRPRESLYGGTTTSASKGKAGANFCRAGAKVAKGDLGAPSFAISDAATFCLEGNFSKVEHPPHEAVSFQRYTQT